MPGAELQLPLLTDLLTIRLPDLTEDPQLSLPPRIKTGPETKTVVSNRLAFSSYSHS